MTGLARSIRDLFGAFPREKDDVRASGLFDCFYGAGGGCGGDGLELCTESLGSESSDGRLDTEEEEALLEGTAWGAASVAEHCDDGNIDDDDDDDVRLEAELMRRERRKTEFPPPLRWMAGADGRRAGIIRAERRDGRLLLTEVRIERHDVFRATREGGCLRLHAVDSEGYDDDDDDEDAEEEEEEEEEELDESATSTATIKENVEGWESQRGVDGFRRCHDPNHDVLALSHHRFVTMA